MSAEMPQGPKFDDKTNQVGESVPKADAKYMKEFKTFSEEVSRDFANYPVAKAMSVLDEAVQGKYQVKVERNADGKYVDMKWMDAEKPTGLIGYLKTYGDVAALQIVLKKLGFDSGKIDGVWGTKTMDALMAFQKKNGLKEDGAFGPRTFAALKKALKMAPAEAPTPNPQTPEEVDEKEAADLKEKETPLGTPDPENLEDLRAERADARIVQPEQGVNATKMKLETMKVKALFDNFNLGLAKGNVEDLKSQFKTLADVRKAGEALLEQFNVKILELPFEASINIPSQLTAHLMQVDQRAKGLSPNKMNFEVAINKNDGGIYLMTTIGDVKTLYSGGAWKRIDQ